MDRDNTRYGGQGAARAGVSGWALLLCLVLAGSGSPARATQVLRFNEVTVPVAEQGAAFQEAMRVALVRATGRRDAALDPALQPLVSDARRYVQIYRPASGGSGTQVTFDAAAVERAIVAAGRSVWPRERPVALVVITQAPPGADPAAARRALEDVASARGLPVSLTPAQSAGLFGAVSVTSEVALAAARRLGADVALVGRGDASGWQWTYFGASDEQVFSGGIGAGIEGAADALAADAQALMAQPELEVLVQVGGVATLAGYAQASRLLGAAAGVGSVTLVEAGADSAVFRVMVRGGPEGLAAALATNPRLRALEGGAQRLAYTLEP
jgi:hypothetical protein